MKFSAISLILSAGLAISQVGAAPLRVVVVSEHFSGAGSSGFVRVGHAAGANPHQNSHHNPNVATIHGVTNVHMTAKLAGLKAGSKPKHGCAGSFRAKAVGLSNWFRHAFGMPSIVAHPHSVPALPQAPGIPTEMVHIMPVGNISEARPHGHPHFRPHHGVHAHHHFARPHTFVQRLTHALMILGPWEGRAVSFILGCGIGVLIRMFWVLAVLAVRSIRGKKEEEEFLGDEVIFEEEEHLLAPPQYMEEYVLAVEEKKEEKTDAPAA